MVWKYGALWAVIGLLSLGIAACGQAKAPVETEAVVLAGPPRLYLQDALSSTWSEFAIQSGNYEWSVVEGEEVQSMIACGSHPLDVAPDQMERLIVPEYQSMDAVLFSLSCDVAPDRLTVEMWDISALGDAEEKAEETRIYEDAMLIELKADKVYEVTAEWTEERQKERGFSGTASYALITD